VRYCCTGGLSSAAQTHSKRRWANHLCLLPSLTAASRQAINTMFSKTADFQVCVPKSSFNTTHRTNMCKGPVVATQLWCDCSLNCIITHCTHLALNDAELGGQSTANLPETCKVKAQSATSLRVLMISSCRALVLTICTGGAARMWRWRKALSLDRRVPPCTAACAEQASAAVPAGSSSKGWLQQSAGHCS
jgi:hypothetical protein